jgi:hypothetical protein
MQIAPVGNGRSSKALQLAIPAKSWSPKLSGAEPEFSSSVNIAI